MKPSFCSAVKSFFTFGYFTPKEEPASSPTFNYTCCVVNALYRYLEKQKSIRS